MKRLRFLLPLLPAVVSASATTMVSFENTVFCMSAASGVVSVRQEKKNMSGVRLDVYREIENGERPVWTGVTDHSGTVKLPELIAGKYRAFVDAGKNSGTIFLTVSDSSNPAVCELKLAPPPKPPAEILNDIAQTAPAIQLTKFQGVVEDESEAVIPKLKITIFRARTFGKSIAEIESDEIGQFHLSLSAGHYVAFFESAGFRRQAVAFKIGKRGLNGFKLTMIVGGSLTGSPLPIEWTPGK